MSIGLGNSCPFLFLDFLREKKKKRGNYINESGTPEFPCTEPNVSPSAQARGDRVFQPQWRTVPQTLDKTGPENVSLTSENSLKYRREERRQSEAESFFFFHTRILISKV